MKIKAIITGATGMVGEGVLHECLHHPDIEQVLIINRKPTGVSHPKLKEIIHENFFDLTPIKHELMGYDACYFCLGVSSVGMKEPAYTRLTYELTMYFAREVSILNFDMVFCYVSGVNTDSTEKGRIMWARIKGKTENQLMQLPFKKAYLFRPGYMHPTPGLKNTLKYYKYLSWLYPILKITNKNMVSTLAELGQAMINVTKYGYPHHHIEVKDIKILAAM